MAKLPFRAVTATGDVWEIAFPLHAETGAPLRVAQLLSGVLGQIDRDLKLFGEVGNGDVLQALAMALAVRAGTIEAPKRTTDALARDLLAAALGAMDEATRRAPASGRA